ncbi:uncharacterized protein PHALS_15487 [Plasmopara halstedii]|uniref:Uncharacterized protein n=1 Tax=Plasmopara halstedii TaxID=4781 RepID=A0A0P1AIE8_PLAHL|nr:uncharacterized protein PHALS_15487 [Plasmopara halstedii]CEG41089.1 hypothetical protein PHALS_15487 [Plasmopara halstedii]|eukprot:XP_024577458.1 hypothetical protein PHALS_15487 [Plasmopara halstedii]
MSQSRLVDEALRVATWKDEPNSSERWSKNGKYIMITTNCEDHQRIYEKLRVEKTIGRYFY